MNSNAPFSFVPIDNRRSTEKPRSNGLSMVIDDGLPTDYVKDVLRTSSAYIDLMKIKTGTQSVFI